MIFRKGSVLILEKSDENILNRCLILLKDILTIEDEN